MRVPKRLFTIPAGLLVLSILLPGTAVMQATPAASSVEGSGRSAPGARMHPALLPSADSAVTAEADAPHGREFDDATFASLRLAATRGQAAAPTASSLDSVAAGTAAAVQASAPSAPTLGGAYDGFTYTGWIPPDPSMAAGPTDLVVSVNESFRIYNKAIPGAQLFNTTLISWFANVLPNPNSGFSVFDPQPIYDSVSGRFVILATAKRSSDSQSRFLISVSDNNSAAGGWCNWSLDAKLNGSTSTNNWADYSKIGTTNNSLILSANMYTPFTGASSFQYAKLRFLEKADLYNTTCPGVNWWDFWNLTNPNGSKAFTIQPSLSYFSSNVSYLVNHTTSGNGSGLTKWTTDTTACCSSGPTLTKTNIATASYTVPPGAEQKGSATRVDTGDARLQGAVYRSSGIWTSATTGCVFTGQPTRACLRWYNINPSTNALTQQSTFGLSTAYYFYPQFSADASGNAVVVFNRSSTTEFPSIRYTGRLSTDALSSLQGSAQLRAGQGCYVKTDSSGRNRWGDYNGAAIDPSVAKTWWIFSEYAFGTSATCTSNTWRTTVGKVFFP